MNQVTFSCVIPCYNAGEGIIHTLDSLAAQSRRPDEIIVVDDGSKDDSPELAANHAIQPRVIRQPNQGAARARFNGATSATGDVVVFTDAGDESDANRLSVFADLFQRYPEAIAATARVYLPQEDRPSKWYGNEGETTALLPDPLKLMLGQSWPMAIAMNLAIRRPQACIAADVKPEFRAGNDYALQVRCAALGPVAIASETTLSYEMTAGGISQLTGLQRQNAFALLAAAEVVSEAENVTDEHRAIFRQRLRSELGELLVNALKHKDQFLISSLLKLGGLRVLHPSTLRRMWWELAR